jgi:hypothetical protein
MTSSQPSAPASPLEPGDDVFTPSGDRARILRIEDGEALIYWPGRSTLGTCEQARFRLKHLRRC